MTEITIYGIPNCDITRKTINWFNNKRIDFTFHDYRQKGITQKKLEEWCRKLDWKAIFNKRSTTWRELSEAEQKKIINQSAAINAMITHNSIIKRPVIEIGQKTVVGFNETEITKHLK